MAQNERVGGVEMEASLDTSKFDAGVKRMEGGVRKLDPAFKKTETAILGVEKAAKTTAGGFSLLQSSVSKFTAGLLGASIIQRSIVWLQQWGRAVIQASSNLTELTSKAQVVFGDSFPKVQNASRLVAQEVGRASSAILNFATDFGAVISAFGIAGPLMDDMSVRLARLAVDMASFRNVSDEEAFMALRSGLTGETEPLKRFGIVLTDTNLKFFALEKGIKTKVEAMNQAQKTALRYEFIMEKTALAQGDAARTADSFANQSRRLEGEIRSLNEEAGKLATPVLADAIGGLAKGFQSVRLFVRALTNDIGSLIEMIGMIPGVSAVTKASGVISDAVKSLPGVQQALQAQQLFGGLFGSIGNRLEADKQSETSGELGAKLDALTGFNALGGAGGTTGSGGGAAEMAEKLAKAEDEVLKALGEQAKANLENLKTRRKELEIRRDLSVASAKELRELEKINGRIEFQEDMVDRATKAWEKQKDVVGKLKDEITGINEEIVDTTEKLQDRLDDIDKRTSERKAEKIAELVRERDKIRGGSSISGDDSRRLGEIEAELAGIDPSLLIAGSEQAKLTDLQQIDAEGAADKARARQDAEDSLLESRSKLAEKTKELQAAEQDLKVASDEVVKTLDTMRTTTESNFTAIEDRTKTHVDKQILELSRLRAAYSSLYGASAGAQAASELKGVAGMAFADGGTVPGRGHDRSDNVLARLSPGERVVTAAKNRMYAPVLDAIHRGTFPIPRFADGGVVNHNERSATINITNNGRAAEVFADPRRVKWYARTIL